MNLHKLAHLIKKFGFFLANRIFTFLEFFKRVRTLLSVRPGLADLPSIYNVLVSPLLGSALPQTSQWPPPKPQQPTPWSGGWGRKHVDKKSPKCSRVDLNSDPFQPSQPSWACRQTQNYPMWPQNT